MTPTSVSVTLSRPLEGTGSTPTLPARYAHWRSLRALEAVQRYTGLQDRVATFLRKRRPLASPDWPGVLAAQLSAWRTAAELRSHDDRSLADIEIPRAMIGAVATLSAFGLPAGAKAAPLAGPADSAWSRLRRSFLPTREELDESYLAGSADLYDLEGRMAELDRRGTSRLRP